MALAAGQVHSGGHVRDADGRRVVVIEQTAGTKTFSGGERRDADGRAVVTLEKNQ